MENGGPIILQSCLVVDCIASLIMISLVVYVLVARPMKVVLVLVLALIAVVVVVVVVVVVAFVVGTRLPDDSARKPSSLRSSIVQSH
jgi:hypothetical protein